MRYLKVFGFTLLLHFAAQSLEPFKITESGRAFDVSSATEVALGAGESNNYQNLPFRPVLSKDIKASYLENQLWLKVTLLNTTDRNQERVLYLTSPLVGRLELYDASGYVNQTTGGGVPALERSLNARLPGFRISLKANETKEFYIKRESHHSLATRVEISDLQTFLENESSQKSYFFLYIGGMGCLILFNLLIGLYTHDRGFIYYSLFALTIGSTVCVLYGVIDSYFIEGTRFIISNYLMCFSGLSSIMALIFAYRFLNLDRYLLGVKKYFKLIGLMASVVLVQGLCIGTSLFWNKMGYITDLVVVLTLISLILSGFLSLKNGAQMSKFFLISWMFMFIGVMGYFGAAYGLLPSAPLFRHGLLFGSLVEMIVISLGLAYKLNILEVERRRAEESAAEKEHYHRLVKVLSHDISNAMTLLSAYAVRLHRRLIEPEDQPFLGKINSTIQKINDILGLVKKEEAFKSFKESIELKPVGLQEVVADVLHFYQDQFEAKNLKAEMAIPTEVQVFADRTALAHQVISNIISNAIKFSRTGGVISVYVEDGESAYRLVFEDRGVGIPKELIEKIFFTSVAISTGGTKNESGSGFGSSLIRDYMSLFRGQLEIQSKVAAEASSGSGTKVILVFPKILSGINT